MPRALEAAQEDRAALVTTEVGTTAHPWLTRIDGLHALSPQSTGSGYLWSVYADEDEEPVVHLLRMPEEAVPGGDPCTGGFYPPGGDFAVTACTTSDGGTWRRSADPYWPQLVPRVDGHGSGRQPPPTCRSASSRRRSGMHDR